ncbi:unnamed protein product [Paramecium sonneborni]|uniref:Thioredoxin domain-containing protein n=1 Tax=Paramecium sonneborni TaxID=65129 RepID=A0A8S1JYV9_9CILI|nr:unnamed protein product [Paramecium sonneborni]
MKFNLIFCFIALLLAQDPTETATVQDENPTTVETPQPQIQPIVALPNNVDALISGHRLILIEFYASWCAPCKQFAPEYQQLTDKASKHSIACAAYDSQRDPDRYALEKFKISSFPTFIFFMDGKPFQFAGQRSADSMLQWMLQLVNGPNPTEILTQEQFNQFLNDNDVVLYYQLSENNVNDPNYWTFFEMSKTNSDAAFAFSFLFNIGKPGRLYYYSKESSEKKQFNQAFTKQNIQRFLLQNQLPDVPQLNDQSEKLVYSGATPAFILFSSLDEQSIKAEKAFIETAQLFKKTYQFSYTKITDEKFFDQLNNLGADDNVFPKIIAWNQGLKYKYNGPDFTVKGIKSFIFDFRQGKLEKFIKSEPLPDYSQEKTYVRKVVAFNYDEEVIKNKKDVLLEFYAEWCGACKQFKPLYDQIAYELRDNPNLVVAQINAPDNEISDVYSPHSYPDLVLFRAADKQRKAIPWKGEDRTVESVLEFVRNNTIVAK